MKIRYFADTDTLYIELRMNTMRLGLCLMGMASFVFAAEP